MKNEENIFHFNFILLIIGAILEAIALFIWIFSSMTLISFILFLIGMIIWNNDLGYCINELLNRILKLNHMKEI